MGSKAPKIEGIEVGSLEELGLSRMTPFVKLGLDAMNSEWRELEIEVAGLIVDFKSNIVTEAAKLAPLGRFQSESDDSAPLSPARLSELLKGFNGLIGKSGGPNGESGFDGLRRVFGAVNLLHTTFNDYKQFTRQASNSALSNIKM